MDQINRFIVGNFYTNDQIRLSLRVENLGGIRPALDERKVLRHIVIMTHSLDSKSNFSENPYYDRIENNILIYTAAGREGNQELTGRNKRIIEQYSYPVPIYGFLNHGKQVYEFIGLLSLLRHYSEYQIDKNKNFRKVWVFEFKINNEIDTVPINSAQSIVENILIDSRVLPEDKDKILANSTPIMNGSTDLNIEQSRAKLFGVNPKNFEFLIQELLQKNGFKEVSVTKFSGDGGIDINGFADDYYRFFKGTFTQFQVKRWRHSVGSPDINGFRGALNSNAKGVFITTSNYTIGAIENAYSIQKPCVTLINGYELSDLVIKTNLNLEKYMG